MFGRQPKVRLCEQWTYSTSSDAVVAFTRLRC